MVERPSLAATVEARPPWWRDDRVIKVLLQVAFVAGVVLVGSVLWRNLQIGLARAGLSLGFHFLNNSANFGITEGIPYDPSESYLKAFWVGTVNTIWLSSLSIALATVMGLVLGGARLCSSWLARQLALIVTEVFRNVPVLLIIMFWYQGVILMLPTVRESLSVAGLIFISQRGVKLPGLAVTLWIIPALGALVGVAWGLAVLIAKQRPDVMPWQRWGLAALGGLLAAGCVWLLVPEPPLALDIPVLERFNFRGGIALSVELPAMLLGLVTYTGAYIAEVVRGAFLAVPKGQWEAARALGLSEWQTFAQVITPQALRIMIPSLNTQYLTLIKNSSLGIAVGYSDMFNISSTIINQSGRSVEMFAIVMAAYLTMNLCVSYGMNWLNNRVKLVER
ncbi:MAG: ABC transporter permease subunit [Thermostichales cyanobacterium DRC_bins_46]